jgi:hypothetical protein
VVLAVLLLVVFVSLAERAQAAQPRPTLRAKAAAYDPASDRYTGQRAASDPWLSALMDSGRAFWKSRGVTIPDRIQLDVADDLRAGDTGLTGERPLGRAWQDGSGRVALDAASVGQALRRARSRRRPTAARRQALKEVAATLLHEMGHTGGLPHVEDEGFMGLSSGQGLVPQETARVIRRLVPRRPGEKPGGIAGVG